MVRILDVDEPSPAYFRERARLEVMGPELDAVLIGLVEDEGVDENVRANAVILLAEKRQNEAEHAEGLGMYPVKGREFLEMKPSDLFEAPQVALSVNRSMQQLGAVPREGATLAESIVVLSRGLQLLSEEG